jgi:hypothetical protein
MFLVGLISAGAMDQVYAQSADAPDVIANGTGELDREYDRYLAFKSLLSKRYKLDF